jgi:hypothetical protein
VYTFANKLLTLPDKTGKNLKQFQDAGIKKDVSNFRRQDFTFVAEQ